MKHCTVISLLILLYAWVINFTYASQCLPSVSIVEHNLKSNKYKLAESIFDGEILAEIPSISKHLKLFEQERLETAEHVDATADENQFLSSFGSRINAETQLSKIRNIVSSSEYIDDIFIVAQEYNIDPLLLHAIAEIESRYNPSAISPAGAKGLMQVMPETARRFGMQNPEKELFDPKSNLRICSNYLRSLYTLFGNDLALILAAYNAGEKAVIKYGFSIPPYRETQQYVTKVISRYLELKNESMLF
jgi:soluble lytic murein transglycosylase-like protein